MMSDQTIFNQSSGSNPPNTPPVNQPTGNVPNDPAIDTLLAGIKNERGEPKYRSLHDALVALAHSQSYIPQLTTQLSEKDRELSEARAAAAKVEELQRSIEALTQRQEPPQTTSPVGLNEEQIAELVNRTLTNKQKADLATQNQQAVATSLSSAFGTDAEAKYNAKAEELGITVADLNALAARSPKAVMAYFGVQAVAKPNVAPTQSTVNTTGIQPHQDSFVGRNKTPVMIGATSQDFKQEFESTKKMVDELHAEGLTTYDLTDPKVYFKRFG